MTEWRSGQFDRTRVAGVFHPFTPAHAADNLESVDLRRLWDEGKRLLLVDVDNTLVQWRGENFSPAVLEWIASAKEFGFEICIISNTKRTDRLRRLSEILGVATVRGRFKPSRAMFRLALIKFKRKPGEAVMIGDQMMTDILGANRAGIDAIWVRKMEGKEFGPTSINRAIERFLTSRIYNALVVPESAHYPRPTADIETPLGKQIVRFVVVGGASFVIDTLLTYLLMRWIPINGEPMGTVVGRSLLHSAPGLFGFADTPMKASAPILGGIASFVAMFNSFVFNRLWTFEARGKDAKVRQMTRFYLVAVTGAILNSLLFTTVFNRLPSHMGHTILAAKVVAAAIVAVWNFVGQRFFAFQTRKL